MPKYILWAFAAATLLGIGSYFYIVAATGQYVYSSIEKVPHAQAAMVLGASVRQDGTLSPVLRARADAAAELYRAGEVRKILVTGDNSEVAHNEVNPTGKYLLLLGIPKADIFLDHAGFDTYSSMYRARDVFGIESVVIISQPFHLPRAVFAARALGLEAFGLEAAPLAGDFLYNWLREVPATWKALFDLAFLRQPKYLGEKIDITGDGAPTWADAPAATTTPKNNLSASVV